MMQQLPTFEQMITEARRDAALSKADRLSGRPDRQFQRTPERVTQSQHVPAPGDAEVSGFQQLVGTIVLRMMGKTVTDKKIRKAARKLHAEDPAFSVEQAERRLRRCSQKLPSCSIEQVLSSLEQSMDILRRHGMDPYGTE